MATVKAFIRASKKSVQKSNIRFRLSDGRNVQLFHKSSIEVDPEQWDSKKECYKAKCLISPEVREMFNKAVSDRKNLLLKVYNKADNTNLNSEIFETLIDQELNPDKYKPEGETIFQSFDAFLYRNNPSNRRINSYTVIKRILQRYELFVAMNLNKPFSLTFEYITPEVLEDLESFIRNEHTLCKEYPEIYKVIKESRTPQQRGPNRMVEIFKKLRAFIRWSNSAGKTTNNPFENYSIGEEVYGTPIYITIEERNKIYKTDFSDRPALEVQKDIFIFQCLTGCRIGDFYKLTPDNIINGAIEYIPVKTKEGRPVTVRVPLNDTAKEIIERYKGVDPKGRILPFISEQKYNKAIKEVFTKAEVNRIVTVINPTTREEEKKPINKIASSHLARRTFVGNLYKKVKDPNLVGALSGHKEGSKAFVRYRDIDEDIRKDVIKLLD